MNFEEVKPTIEKVLKFLSETENPESYLYDGKLTLKSFYDSIFLGNLRYSTEKIGIDKMDYFQLSAFVNEDFAKLNYNFVFNIHKEFGDYFLNIDDENKNFIENINEKRGTKGLELISFEN